MMYLMTTTAKGPVTIGPFSNDAQVQTFLEGAEQRGLERDQFSQAMVRSAIEFLGRFPEEDEETRKKRQEAKQVVPAHSAKPQAPATHGRQPASR